MSPLILRQYSHSYVGNLSGKIVWGALDDVVMGGVSESTFQILPTGSETGGPTGLFKGICFSSLNLVYEMLHLLEMLLL